MSQATNLLLADIGNNFSGKYSTPEEALLAFASKLKTVKVCPLGADTYGECWSELGEMENLYGVNHSEFNGDRAAFVLNSGAFVSISNFSFDSTCSRNFYRQNDENQWCTFIDVDINGAKGPNQYGRDIFMYYMTKHKIVLNGTAGTHVDGSRCSLTDSSTWSGEGCAGKIAKEGWKMNY